MGQSPSFDNFSYCLFLLQSNGQYLRNKDNYDEFNSPLFLTLMGVLLVLAVKHDASLVFCNLLFDSTVADLLTPFHLNGLNSPQFSTPSLLMLNLLWQGGGGEGLMESQQLYGVVVAV